MATSKNESGLLATSPSFDEFDALNALSANWTTPSIQMARFSSNSTDLNGFTSSLNNSTLNTCQVPHDHKLF